MIKKYLKENALEDLCSDIEQMRETLKRLIKVRKSLSKDTPLSTSTDNSELRDVKEKIFDLERDIRLAERFLLLSQCLFKTA